MSTKDTVLAYLRRGWAPIPIAYREKNPGAAGGAGDEWQRLRVTEATLNEHFNGKPQNIGILMGEPSGGLNDIDLDCPEALALADWFLPATGAEFGRKSARRSHRLYLAGIRKKLTFDDPIRKSEKRPDDKGRLLEVLATGQQLVAPGSVHKDTGEAIEWSKEGDPATVDAGDLAETAGRLAAAALLCRYWPAPSSHCRHDTAMALSGGLLSARWTEEEVRRFIAAVATEAGDEELRDRLATVGTTAERLRSGQEATGWPTLSELTDERVVGAVRKWLRCERSPGWTVELREDPLAGADTRNIVDIADIALRTSETAWEPPIPFSEAEVPDFPTGVFPAWLRMFVEAEAEATQTPPDLAAMLTLGALAVAGAKKVEIRIRGGWVEPLNLYTATALPPGARKTTVFSDVTRPIEAYEAGEAQRVAPEVAVAQSGHRIAEGRLKAAESAAAKAKLMDRGRLEEEAREAAEEFESLDVPVVPRLLADDTSPERLATLLRDQGGRMALMSAEGGVFDLMAGRYSTNSAPNFEVFLKAHAGDTLRVDRVGRPAEYVPRPALTLALAVQPDVIRGLAALPSFRGRGLLGRFAYSMPRNRLGHRNSRAPAVPENVRDDYDRHLYQLLTLDPGKDAQGHFNTAVLRLDEEAEEAMLVFAEWLEPQLAEWGTLGYMTDWAGKLAGLVGRIAGLLHLADRAGHANPWEEPVEVATVERALQVGRYLIPHARAAYSEMGADPVVGDARHVLAWLKRHETVEIRSRDLFAGVRSRFDDKMEKMEPAIAVLIEHGYLRVKPVERPPGRGRPPSPVLEINPLAQYSQNPQNPAHAPNIVDFVNIVPKEPETDTASQSEPPPGEVSEGQPSAEDAEVMALFPDLGEPTPQGLARS